MANFKQIIDCPAGSKFILQGNEAFALGVVHGGYHAADGYPGTPSTEVIDKSLALVQDRMKVGWSVNEAVAMGVAMGHAIAGFDTVVTMKLPGVFQAGDAISTGAFYTGEAGAIVIYAASDYVPSSTQHVIDPRYFFASCRLPILEPRNHQEMYDIAKIAADMSRDFKTPVVVLASGILCHSEGLVVTGKPRKIEPRPLPADINAWMTMPGIARANYNSISKNRIPAIREWGESSPLVSHTIGTDEYGIIVNGEAEIIVKEALASLNQNPSILSLGISNPLPIKRIKEFGAGVKGKLFIIEDGDRFIEERLLGMGVDVIGKGEDSIITDWTPEGIIEFLSQHIPLQYSRDIHSIDIKSLNRPPSICPGCPYRAFGLSVAKLRQKKQIYASFGDIGCSTLLYFLKAIDTVCCMGASDSMRQGFVLSRPDMGHKVISVIGDSCECHSGLDSTRNAVFRNTPGVKVILDNRITAMTGGQRAPSSPSNLEGVANKFNLVEAVGAEKCRTIRANSYNLKEVERTLTEALELAEKGEFTVLILEGACIQDTEVKKKVRKLQINRDKCKQCGMCGICPGIRHDEERRPHFTILCTNCGSNMQVCKQRCPFGAIEEIQEDREPEKGEWRQELKTELEFKQIDKASLPSSLRVAIRGIGGQGNLFFGKVLSEVAMGTPYSETNIVKGDTHGMAQLGGPVISTFSCGDIYAPTLAPHSADVLVVMESGEILRPGFLNLLKEGGTILFNLFKALPITAKKEDYPDIEEILKKLKVMNLNAITVDAYGIVEELGDKSGKTSNVLMLGLLSTIDPFNRIPFETWLGALMRISPSESARWMNHKVFIAGRDLKRK